MAEIQIERNLDVDIGGGEVSGVGECLLGRGEAEVGTGGKADLAEDGRVERHANHAAVQICLAVEESIGGILLVEESVALMDVGSVDTELTGGLAAKRQGHYQTDYGQ